MSIIKDFATEVLLAYNAHDDQRFAQLFQLGANNHVVVVLQQELVKINDIQLEEMVASVLEETSNALAEFVLSYLQLLRNMGHSSLGHTFDYFASFYSALIPVFNGSETHYQVPLIKTMSSALVQLAFKVDFQEQLKGKARKANDAARLLSKMFNIMLADRSPMETSKRQGIFYVTNLAFKVYFKLNSVRLCQTFISNIRTGEVDLREFPMAQQVTYRYYLGRYFLYQNRLRKAEDHLRFAFEKCAAPCWKNKRLILQYLIPTRLLLGRFPMPQLLAKYQLQEQYLPLIVHLKSGNIAGYMSHIDQHFHYFYSTFTYMMLRERGTVLLWRCLIRKLYTIMRISNAAHIALSFETCLKALHFSSQDTTLDLRDMECILVSLVSQNYIRGYLHHQKHRLVLSKVNPFPPVSHIRVHTERYNEELVEAHLDDHQPEIPMEIQQLLDE